MANEPKAILITNQRLKLTTSFCIDATLLGQFKQKVYEHADGSYRGAMSRAISEAIQLWIQWVEDTDNVKPKMDEAEADNSDAYDPGEVEPA